MSTNASRLRGKYIDGKVSFMFKVQPSEETGTRMNVLSAINRIAGKNQGIKRRGLSMALGATVF